MLFRFGSSQSFCSAELRRFRPSGPRSRISRLSCLAVAHRNLGHPDVHLALDSIRAGFLARLRSAGWIASDHLLRGTYQRILAGPIERSTISRMSHS